MTEPAIRLKPGREKSLLRRHPWIFEGGVERVEGSPAAGDIVAVRGADGAFLARAGYSPASQIVARVWSFDERERIDDAQVVARIERAVARRARLADRTDAMRLVNSESDDLPGLVVDRYAGGLSCQFLTAPIERMREPILDALAAIPGVHAIYDRSDGLARKREGLPPRGGLVRGEAPEGPFEIRETPRGAGGKERRFLVDLSGGQKTGFYLDQRENRDLVASLARGREAINVFCYTGGFSVAALEGGAASVLGVDSSRPALELADRNIRLNDLPEQGFVEADAFELLRKHRDEGRRFDMVVLDPPKLAATRARVDRAARAYKDINWLAFRILRPGGVLVTFSCSGAVDADLFRKIVFGAALDARVEASVIGHSIPAEDHAVRLSFPEGEYLKGLVCRVD